MSNVARPLTIAVMASGLLGLFGLLTPASADVQANTVHSGAQAPSGKLLSPLAGTPASDDKGDDADDSGEDSAS